LLSFEKNTQKILMTIKVFITGGTGFIGANLIRLLIDEGYLVKALVRSESCLKNLENLEIEIVTGDLNDVDLDRHLKDSQILFHVAALYSLWQSDRELLYRANVLGTRNVLAAARKANIERVIYTSSVAAIGVGKSGEIVNETHQSPVEKLIGHYKKSKYFAEQEAIKATQMGQDIVIVNPTAPIGAWDIKPTPTGDIILRFLRRQMPAYVDTGLNFIDVKDVARGHLLALEKGRTGDRYILGNQNLTLRSLLALLAKITGLEAPQNIVPFWLPLGVAWIEERLLAPLGKPPTIPFDGVRMSQKPMYYNASKAVKELNLPQSSIESAIGDAVAWFTERGYI
jgi:dihydroflavonol-4-reductase